MRYITVQRGERLFFVEEQRTEAVIMKPYIEKVPAGREEIQGISCYEGKVAVYFRLGEAEENCCAVLLKSRGNIFIGISGDAVGQEERGREDLTEITSGVWEEKDDTTDG